MGCLMRRHRLEHLKTQEAEQAEREALYEAAVKQMQAEEVAPPVVDVVDQLFVEPKKVKQKPK